MPITPHVKFSPGSASFEVDMLYGFIFEDRWGWGERIFKIHPKLKFVLRLDSEPERLRFFAEYVRTYRRTNKVGMKRRQAAIRHAWKRIERPAFLALRQLLETDWPKGKRILAEMSLNPICPRMLKLWKFTYYWRFKNADIFEIIIHESCHFLYFKKWLEVFPKAKRRTFDSPYLTWHLSEIVAPILLKTPELQKFIHQRPLFYREHKRLRISRQSVPAYFETMYRRSVARGEPFANFLREANLVMQRHRNIFRNV